MPGGSLESPQNSIFISKTLEAIVPEGILLKVFHPYWNPNLTIGGP